MYKTGPFATFRHATSRARQSRSMRYVHVLTAKRREIGDRLGLPCQWGSSEKHQREGAGVLPAPSRKLAVGKLAEVNSQCWWSSVYYLLLGQKSGTKLDVEKISGEIFWKTS